MYTKKDIVKILVNRDSFSTEEAQQQIADCQAEIDAILEDMDCGFSALEEVESVVLDYLGLEPDYAMDFIPF